MSWNAVSLGKENELFVASQAPSGGPPILCLHGVTRIWRDWLPFISGLSNRWTPYCLDFRGHGSSSPQPGRYRVVDYVHDALTVLDSVLKGPVILLGHSLGAMVSLAVAAQRPERVTALVLEDPPFETMGKRIADTPLLSQFQGMRGLLRESADATITLIARRLADLHVTNPLTGETVRLGDRRDAASLRFHASCLKQLDPETLVPIIEGRWLEKYDWRALASRVACPVLLLQADIGAGGMLTDQDAGDLMNILSDATLVRFPGTGHQIHGVATGAALRATSAFLESLPLEHPSLRRNTSNF